MNSDVAIILPHHYFSILFPDELESLFVVDFAVQFTSLVIQCFVALAKLMIESYKVVFFVKRTVVDDVSDKYNARLFEPLHHEIFHTDVNECNKNDASFISIENLDALYVSVVNINTDRPSKFNDDISGIVVPVARWQISHYCTAIVEFLLVPPSSYLQCLHSMCCDSPLGFQEFNTTPQCSHFFIYIVIQAGNCFFQCTIYEHATHVDQTKLNQTPEIL